MITSCYKITVDQFCDCLFDKQLSVLGEGSDQEQQDAWNKIYIEYCDLMNDASYNESFNLVKQIQELNAKIDLASSILGYLRIVRDEELEKMLKQIGIITHKELGKLQASVLSKTKKWAAELLVMQQQLNKLMENKKEGGRDSYEDSLIYFGKNDKIHYSSTTTTIYQFIKLYKEYDRQAQKAALSPRN